MARSYPSWIAGVPYVGPDGTDRAAFCASLRPGEKLALVPEPTNIHDPDAVAIYCRGHHLGYVPARHHWVHDSLHEGDELECIVTDIDCPTPGRAEHVHIRISVLADGSEPDDEVARVLAPSNIPVAPRRSLARRIVGIAVGVAVVAAAALLAFGRDGSSPADTRPEAPSQRSQEAVPTANSAAAVVPLPRPRQRPQAGRAPLDIRPATGR